ncbi:hypothetical protein PMAL9190_01405 [Photobacterium malacitanum]|uniref:Uncharacterized protein n=1 Tax=Photobacterium malacitanum TaxID=2204294 RepID=A0A1Y6MBN0_9GAMM|nr:hypothetical protein [Photobacterium malacitanum]SMY33946.1 hypothetical protein PMAL9190_01405 [Photobacterium malacitanum]
MVQAKELRRYFINDERQHIFMLQNQVRQLIILKKDRVEIERGLVALEAAWIAFENKNN